MVQYLEVNSMHSTGEAGERCINEAKMYYCKYVAGQKFRRHQLFNMEPFEMNTIKNQQRIYL